MTIDLTENEAAVIQNALWLHAGSVTPAGAYIEWLQSAMAKISAAMPKPPEFAENH